MNKVAIVTGASGGMGLEIAIALADANYRVIMACRNKEKALSKREIVIHKTGNSNIEIAELDLSSLTSVKACATHIIQTYGSIDILMNNAGSIPTHFEQTEDGLEKSVSTNYVGHYLFTRMLSPHMKPGSRIVNMVSCTCRIGTIDLPDFFTNGRKGTFRRMLIYSNTKLALLLFTLELSEQLKEKGIYVNAADPGIVSTDIISMQKWFDPLADIFFRPFIRKPLKGASGAIDLLLKKEFCEYTGYLSVNNKVKTITDRYQKHPQRKELWNKTEELLETFLKELYKGEFYNGH